MIEEARGSTKLPFELIPGTEGARFDLQRPGRRPQFAA
jgi:hypothetical protein